MKKRIRFISLVLAIFVMLGNVCYVNAEVIHMDNVSGEMCEAAYWYNRQKEPEKVITNADQISKINQDIIDGVGTGVSDLRHASESFDGISYNNDLKTAALNNIDWYLLQAGVMYTNGGVILTKDSFNEVVDNTQNPDASVNQKMQYGIVVNRTAFRGLPTDMMILDEETDYNFDYLYESSLNVNDPLLIKSVSEDGKYYYGIGNCYRGWIPVTDVAICKDKSEWLDAWDFDASNALVVYGDKVTTETTRVNPEISKRTLGMGTVLEMVPQEEWEKLISNRSPYYNHVVWLPVRNDDGSYQKSMALISMHSRVHEGFLPLTYKNISDVAFGMLGNTYGWGGMLDSNDCSGYVKDIYRCFGIVTANNTTNQAKMPIKKYDVSGFTLEEKEKLLKNLPLGTVLIWSGHEMLYLGSENGKFYVINSVSSVIRPDGNGSRVRNVIVNSVDIKRANGKSWLETITTMEIPYIGKDHPLYDHDYLVDDPEEDGQDEKQADDKDSEKQADDKDSEKQADDKDSEKQNGTKTSDIIKVSKTSYVFTQGKTRTVELGATVTGGTLEYFSNNKNVTVDQKGKVTIKKGFVGSAAITITATGEKFITATRNVFITVKPATTTISKKKALKKGFTIKYNKISNIKRYEIQYSTTSKFKKSGTVTKTTISNKLTVKKLKSKKKYYIRVRSYKTVRVNGVCVRLYSKWSKVKTVKTK